MNTLVHQGATTIQCPGASPARIAVVLRRTIPLHPRIHDQRPAQPAFLNQVAQATDILLEPILKNHSELYSSMLACRDESIGALSTDINGLLDKNMQPASRGGNTVAGVQSRWSTNNHHFHGMCQKGAKIAVSCSVVITT